MTVPDKSDPPSPTDALGNQRKVQVEIYGNRYHVFADDDTGRIVELAGRVDKAMRDIARLNPGLAATKIAILAALNFAELAARGDAACKLFANRTEYLLNLISDELNE
ncbi:cell division protein ZapA [bacterium]|nr:cell division protein ZapA [candidate division CSSED10-310 bacterium]